MNVFLRVTFLTLSCFALNAASNAGSETAVKSFDEMVMQGKKPHHAFAELIKGKKPVVVKFFMPGCGPCVSTVEVFEQLAKKYDKAEFVTIDVTKYDLGNQFGIRSVPTFIIFIEGKKIAQSKRGALVQTVEKTLKKYVS